MEPNNTEILFEVVSGVLEAQAFMFADAAEKGDIPPRDGEYYQAKMTFVGPFRGTMALTVPMEMCTEMAANVLGLDMDDEQAEEGAQDALKELLNVACGQVLTELAGEEPVFDLTVPAVTVMDDETWDALTHDENVAAMLVDERPLLTGLWIEES